MEKRKKQSYFPIILIAIGGMLIIGAMLATFLRPTESQETPPPASQVTNTTEITRIRPGEAKAAFDSGEAIIVDVRSEEYYTEKHIRGALSIPLEELQARMDELDKKDWIILY